MARKKIAKRLARKTSTKTVRADRARGKTKPRKPASKTPPSKPAVSGAVESAGAMDLFRAWSPSRYSTR